MATTGTVLPGPEVIQRVAAEVGRVGTARASKVLGLGRESVARIVAGLPVRAGTLALLRERLATIDADPTRGA
jgi:hypothetical protein